MTRFRCVICGKITAGRIPVNPHNHRETGDGSERFPRRHKRLDGKPCPGNMEFAEWVDVPPKTKLRPDQQSVLQYPRG